MPVVSKGLYLHCCGVSISRPRYGLYHDPAEVGLLHGSLLQLFPHMSEAKPRPDSQSDLYVPADTDLPSQCDCGNLLFHDWDGICLQPSPEDEEIASSIGVDGLGWAWGVPGHGIYAHHQGPSSSYHVFVVGARHGRDNGSVRSILWKARLGEDRPSVSRTTEVVWERAREMGRVLPVDSKGR